MSKGQPKTVGQQLGLLTGFGLILGGALGWAYALLKAPGHDAAAPVATPQPPEPISPVVSPVAAPTVQAPGGPALTVDPEEVDSDVVEPPRPATPAGPPPARAVPVKGAPAEVPDAVKAIRAAAAAARQRLETPTPAASETSPTVED